MNIFISPIFALTFAMVFIIIAAYCLKCILFYHEYKKELNEPEWQRELKRKDSNIVTGVKNYGTMTISSNSKKDDIKMDYREFRKKDIYNHSAMKFANDISNDLELKRQKRYEDYLKEVF